MSKPERVSPRHETVMDVTEEQIARVYARAFMGVANKTPDPGAMVEGLESLVHDVLDPSPQLEELFRSELIAHEHKQEIIDRVFGGRASLQMLNFLKVLAIHGRLGLLRPMLKFVNKLYAEQRGLIDVHLRVAKELDAGLEREIADMLRTTLGKEPVLHVAVDPAIVGGIVIQVGDRVFDASIQTRLERARQSIISRATDMIETQPERFLLSAG